MRYVWPVMIMFHMPAYKINTIISIKYCQLIGFAYLNNLACIEFNPWHSTIEQLDNPDYLIIDIDPSEKNSFDQVIETANVVKKTSVIARVEMGRIAVLNSCQEVLKAASYNRGGKKIRNTISGSSARLGKAGTKPINKPTPTNKIG